MPSKKIAFVLTSLRKGGAEGKAQKIIKALSPHFEVELFLFNKVVEYELPQEVKICALGSRYALLRDSWLQLPLILFRLIWFSRKNNLDITYTFDYMPNLLCAINKAFGWKGKVIINQVNNSKLELKTYNFFKRNLIKVFMLRFYPYANQVVVPSRGLKQAIEKQFEMNPDTITYMPNPIDVKQILQLSKESFPENLTAPGGFVFIHVGNHGRAKNHVLLLKAFSKLCHRNCELWLIGRGTDDNVLKRLVSELGVENKVRIFGQVHNPIPFMFKANCLVLSSDYEGSPNVLIEALACKLPIIATDCDYGPREILSDVDLNKTLTDEFEIVKHGILVPVGNVSILTSAMVHCIDYPGLMDSFTEKAAERVLPWDIEKYTNKYIELLC